MSNQNTNSTGSGSLFGGFGNTLGGSQSQGGDKPAFSFGGAGGATSTASAASGTSLFGAKSNTSAQPSQPAQSTGLFGSSGASKPLFGGSAPASGGLFGASAGATTSTPAAPATGLGGNTTGSGTTGGLFGGSAQPNKPAFSFGSTASDAKAADKPADKPTGFSFGAQATTDKPATTGFSFGASKPTEQPTGTQSAAGTATTGSTGFSFGGAGDKKPEGGLFGATEKKDTPAFSFGAKDTKPAASGFTFGAPAEKKDEKPAASGFTFGAPAEKKDEKPAASGFTFGAPAEKKDEKPAASGFTFGAPAEKKDEKPAASGFTFGAPAEKKDEKPAASGFTFGAPAEKKDDKTAEKKDEPKPAFSFGEKKEEKPADKPAFSFGSEKKDGATTAPGAAGSAANVDPAKAEISPSVYLKNKSFEDIVAKWTSALSSSTTRFQTQAEAISEWDRVLADNGAKISEVYNEVVAAEQMQTRIDDLLNYLGRQQDDLEAMLDKYERQAGEILPEGSADRLQPVDRERSEAYALAGQVNTKLDSLEKQLSQVINEINEVTKDAGQLKDEDPLAQIVQVLNSHVASLDWIDENATKLQEKLGQAYSQSSRLHF